MPQQDIFHAIASCEKSGFYQSVKTKLDTYTFDTYNFSDVELFEFSNRDMDLHVNKLYRVKNLGVISFELVNGEVWINENLSKYGTTTIESFD